MEIDIKELEKEIERLVEVFTTRGSFIFELTQDTEMAFLFHYRLCTGSETCVVPAGSKFFIMAGIGDNAFMVHPIDNDSKVEKSLFSVIEEKLLKKYGPKVANRIQDSEFYLTEDQLKSGTLSLLRGDINVLFEFIEKKKAYTAYWKNPENVRKHFIESHDGSFMKEYDECGKPKMLKEKTEICPSCGYKLRPVFWGEITPEVLRQKKEGRIFIGEHLYGKDFGVDCQKKHGDDRCIQPYARPDYACANCGESFLLTQ